MFKQIDANSYSLFVLPFQRVNNRYKDDNKSSLSSPFPINVGNRKATIVSEEKRKNHNLILMSLQMPSD